MRFDLYPLFDLYLVFCGKTKFNRLGLGLAAERSREQQREQQRKQQRVAVSSKEQQRAAKSDSSPMLFSLFWLVY